MPLNMDRVMELRKLSAQQIDLLRSARGMTEQALISAPEAAIRRAVRRLDYPDAPRARHAYRLAQSRDDLGQIPTQALLPALRQLDSLRLRARRGSVAGMPTGTHVEPAALAPVPPPAAGLGRRKWVALGPGNI